MDNSDIGRSADIFPLGQAIENIGRGVLVTGVMGGGNGALVTHYYLLLTHQLVTRLCRTFRNLGPRSSTKRAGRSMSSVAMPDGHKMQPFFMTVKPTSWASP